MQEILTKRERLRAAAPQETAAELWPNISARTDGIYVVVEDLQSVFEGVVGALAAHMGKGVVTLIFGDLKDPVRIHEKALSDYAGDFDDFHDKVVIPEACVIDVLRCRAVCGSAASMLLMQSELKRGFEALLDGKVAKLELLRAKSKFHDLDPTHFRNILNNLALTYAGRRTFVELQVQHSDILNFNDVSHAHDHYNYFRTLLADEYSENLDLMLQRTLSFLSEAAGIPVLLSMLVVLFADGTVDAECLPTNRAELYGASLKMILKRRCKENLKLAKAMLCSIALGNLNADNRREFSSENVKESLDRAGNELWHQLEGEPQGIPLVKILAVPLFGSPGQYQYRHLSVSSARFQTPSVPHHQCHSTCSNMLTARISLVAVPGRALRPGTGG